jgi:hypothetical protein
MKKCVVAVVIALVVAIPVTAAATSAVVRLHNGQRVVFGRVGCEANVEAGFRNLLCQRQPRARAKFEVAIFTSGISVYRMGNPEPVYSTPRR